MVGRELWSLERYFVIINAALYGFVLWVLTLISPIEIAVLNLVTKVSDPHGITADLDTHPTSHYKIVVRNPGTVSALSFFPDPDPASTDPGLRLDSSIRFPFFSALLD